MNTMSAYEWNTCGKHIAGFLGKSNDHDDQIFNYGSSQYHVSSMSPNKVIESQFQSQSNSQYKPFYSFGKGA